MNKISLFFRTIIHIKYMQIVYRLIRLIPKVNVKEATAISYPVRPSNWKHQALFKKKVDRDLNASFLNYTKKLSLPNDWNNEIPSKLWVYNLHYFEYLLSDNKDNEEHIYISLLNRWIDENKIGAGNGWEPYPTSLRIVNVLKVWLGGTELNNKVFNSIFTQADHLSNNLEKHLLGNHYFVNLKALLFAGIVFDNKDWIVIAEKGLLFEINEQILPDGANFELTPMYHSQMLVDMLDIFNLTKAYSGLVSVELISLIRIKIPIMLDYMEAMSHPDNGLSFFNDSVNGIAPNKETIENYAKKLGFKVNNLDLNNTQLIDKKDSGYFCAIHNGNKLLFDASPVGPDYIPGHAHADSLSFELSIGQERVFVNSGISEYGVSKNRLLQRKTKSHNTIEIDEQDSSQVWSGFRVAKRARISNRSSKVIRDQKIVLSASHNGYKTLLNNCIHSRQLTLGHNNLDINDSITGSFKIASGYFHFHPNLKVELEKDYLKVFGKNFKLESNLNCVSSKLLDSLWHPEFGVEIPNKVLKISFERNYLDVSFEWDSF